MYFRERTTVIPADMNLNTDWAKSYATLREIHLVILWRKDNHP
jgi:hypothetical protein